MEPTQAVARRSPGRWLILLGILLSALTLSGIAASPAMAEEVSTVAATEEPATTEEPAATDEPAEEFEYHFRGNVQHDGEPLEGVRITLEGNGFEAETETDADGRWEIGVPEKATYEVTLDEDTLPEGVVVAEGSATREAEFGLTRNASVNFFLGEGVRTTVSFFDQFVQRTVSGLNFGLLLALAAIGLSLIFGTTGLSNFAHAELITFGALMVLTFGVNLAWPLWLAIGMALLLSAALGWGLDAVIWKPLRRKGVGLIQLMIVSIGLSLALRYTYQFFYGGSTSQLPGATLPSDIRFGADRALVGRRREHGREHRRAPRGRLLPRAHPHRQGDPRGLRQPEPRLCERHRRELRHSHRLGARARCSPASPASSGPTSAPV